MLTGFAIFAMRKVRQYSSQRAPLHPLLITFASVSAASLVHEVSITNKQRTHRVFEGSPTVDSDPSTKESDRVKRPRLHYSVIPRAKINVVRELSVGLIVNADLPFSVFTNPYFKQLVWQLDPQVTGQVPWSRHSISRQLNDIYHSKKGIIRQDLRNALIKIHLGFDF